MEPQPGGDAGPSPDPSPFGIPSPRREFGNRPLWIALLTPAAILLGFALVAGVLWVRLDEEGGTSRDPDTGGISAVTPASRAEASRTLVDAFLSYAREVGLDTEAFRQCLADESVGAIIATHEQRGIEFGVNGTPTFFINNKKVVGAQPAAVFDEVIEAELRESPTSLDAYSETIRTLAERGQFAIIDRRPDVSDAHIEGNSEARVIIAEFSDFQCPFCKRWMERALPLLRQRLGNDVAIAYLHFPIEQIHPNAPYAALASVCAGKQGKFWPMHDLLFIRQDDWADLPRR